MKITDNTNQKSDNLTFNVGDVVKAVFDNNNTAFLLIVQSGSDNCHAVQMHLGNTWNNDVQKGTRYTFDNTKWKYTKVNAELIITD